MENKKIKLCCLHTLYVSISYVYSSIHPSIHYHWLFYTGSQEFGDSSSCHLAKGKVYSRQLQFIPTNSCS